MSSDMAQFALDTQPDDASSLRAAALSTLKAKRKKPAPPPSRIASAPESISLNYGAEDSPTNYAAVTIATENQSQRAVSSGKTALREEGEISDSDNASPSSMQSTPNRIIDIPLKMEPVSPREPLLPFSNPGTRSRHRTPSRAAETSRYGPFDANHVRPGLPLTQSQYDIAKDIVLDLLGWDVPPEYLLTCGLSREVIYYTFKELNLRLPNNLDTTGLPPYPLPADIADQLRVGFEPTTPHLPTPQSRPPSRTPKLAEDTMDFVRSPTTSSDTLSLSSLANMEQQRRQELLARKAVIASRKSKQTKENSVNRPDVMDTEMSIAPPPSVDEFLKTMVLKETQQPPKADIETVRPRPAPDAMDVDLPPGLSTVTSTHGKPKDSTLSVSSSVPIIPFDSRSSSSVMTNPEGRRGLKRPVAADFVDSYVDDGDTVYLPPSGRRRPKSNGFAGVSSMRRCVIDLSDSDSEAEDAALYGVPSVELPTKASAFNLHTRSLTPMTPMALTSTPPVSSEPTSVRTMSPAALLEKEIEIRKMRELIAQRELLRQKKLGNASKPSTSASTPVPSVSTPSSADNQINDTNTKTGDIGSKSTINVVSPSTSKEASARIDHEPEDSQGKLGTDVNANPTQNDDNIMIESAKGTSDRIESDFTCYVSPLQGYNFLSSVLPKSSALDPAVSSSSFCRGVIDLQTFRVSQIDPSKPLCEYEVPGGGICRDAGCEDVHLSRIDDDIDDEQLALYLLDKLEGPELDRGKLVEALQAQDRTKTSLEDRVGRALSRIGRPDDVDKIIRHRVKTDVPGLVAERSK